MIKHSTVIKRIIKDGWRPVLLGAAFITSITLGATAAEAFLGWDWGNTYWGLFLGSMFLWMLKSAYDWKKVEIEWEQEKMLRDLGKKND